MDEIAEAGGRDPLEFRIDLLSKKFGKTDFVTERAAAALKLATKNANWDENGPAKAKAWLSTSITAATWLMWRK